MWKLQLDNKPQEMHSLFAPLLVENIKTSSGPKEIAIVAGISDNIYAIDVATDGSAGASFQCKDTGGSSRIVVDAAKETIVGATFTGFETADFLHAATVAIIAEMPLSRLRHAVPAYPTRSEIWLKLLEAYEA